MASSFLNICNIYGKDGHLEDTNRFLKGLLRLYQKYPQKEVAFLWAMALANVYGDSATSSDVSQLNKLNITYFHGLSMLYQNYQEELRVPKTSGRGNSKNLCPRFGE